LVAAFAVDAPTATFGDLAGLFHVEMDHVPGPASMDAPWLAVAGPGGVEEPALAQPEVGQDPGHGATPERHTLGGQFMGDAVGRPLVVAAEPFDAGHRQAGVAAGWWCGVEGRSVRPSSPNWL
jgi:hypothetical protein